MRQKRTWLQVWGLVFVSGVMSVLVAGERALAVVDYPIPIQRGNGLANVFAKLNSGQSATIAYIGGSVTQGWGYRDLVTSWLNSRYPGKITEINAGWSGTGSLIGTMRFNRDVLAYNPDLIFIEFAVNDLPEDALVFVQRNTEGMIRQAWAQNRNIDICFIETIAYYIEQPYLSGYYPTSVQAHYDAADQHGNPSVNVGWALYEYVLGGTSWESLTINGDRVHPNATGSQIYADAITAYLESERTRGAPSTLHSIPSALTDYPVMSGTITEMASLTGLSGAWSKHYNEYGAASFIQSSTVGSTVTLSFTGRSAAAKIIVAPDGGGISYSVDGGAYASGNVPTTGSPYHWAFPVAKTYSNATHTLTLRVDSGVARIINVEDANTSTLSMPALTGTNLALGATTTLTDSYYSSSYDGTKARDGSTSTKWCTTATTMSHWLVYDLGATANVSNIVLKNASIGGEATYYNTEIYTIESGTSTSGPWTAEFPWWNVGQKGSQRFDFASPKALRYVRLYISDPGIDNYARIPEFEVWGQIPSGGGMEDGTPSGSNVAPASSQVSTDSNYSADYAGAKAIDGVVSAASKWCSNGNAPPHWIALDLGSSKTVTGFIARMAGAAGEYTTYNFEAFKFQSGTSISGPWTDECTVSNSAQASVISRRYITAKSLRYVRLYITDAGTDNYARLPEFEVYSTSGGPLTVAEDFNSMPSWSSSFDASWGSAATWSIVAGGQSGNALQAARSSQGSSAKAMVYNITTNTNYTISVYIKCPSYGSSYWAECAYRLGSYTAQNFDESGGSWTMIKKFANDGTNGNGNTWTQYSATFNSGSNTQISVGYKLGSSGGAGPTVLWDTLRVQ